jgi:hypothetical protein
MSKQQMIDFLTSLTQDQIFAILESARISLADAEIAFDVGLKVKMSDADINNLQHKIHEHMDWDIPEYRVNTTQYWCDSCADPIEIGNEFFYSDLPCDIASANEGESGTVCRKCNERIEADYYNKKEKENESE